MNVRKKNAKEREYDQLLIDKARRDLAESGVGFANEFAECDGGVLYEREKENSAMPKVGDTWDWENNVCGAYRYRDI